MMSRLRRVFELQTVVLRTNHPLPSFESVDTVLLRYLYLL